MTRFFSLLLLATTACIPIPRTVSTWPAVRFHVANSAGEPVQAQVLLARWSNPHRRYHQYQALECDPAGEVVVSEEPQREWVMPLMIHGVPEYYWTWCTQAPGYVPQTGTAGPQAGVISVILVAGGGQCELPSAQGESAAEGL